MVDHLPNRMSEFFIVLKDIRKMPIYTTAVASDAAIGNHMILRRYQVAGRIDDKVKER